MRSHVLMTLAGNGVPALAALLAFPLLNERLGTELFGFFMLAWASVGFSSLLDLGLGRAMTHYSALHDAQAGRGHGAEIAAAMALMSVMAGATAVVAMSFVALATTLGWMQDEPQLFWAHQLIAVGLPVGIVNSGIKGCLEGRQHFAAAAVLRTLAGLLLIAMPSLGAWVTGSPLGIAAGLLVGRGLALALYMAYERRQVHLLTYRSSLRPGRAPLQTVLAFTGWISVSTLAGSAMAYMDRIALAATSTLRQAAYYAAPFELVSRVLLVPGAVVTVLFPQLSHSAKHPREVQALVRRGYLACVVLVVPLLCLIALPAQYWLAAWMGQEFSAPAASVIHWLAPGIACNAAAHIPVAALQALGRPGRAARIHLIEFVPAAALFLALTHWAGATGAAAAWTIRCAVDLALMAWSLNADLRRAAPEQGP